MKRSTFLKTLGLSAAAAFCNCRLFAVPQFALPGPTRWDAKLPAELEREDLFEHILNGCMEFARDGIRIGPVEGSGIVAHTIYERGEGGQMVATNLYGPDRKVEHMALESAGVKLGHEMCSEDVEQFIRAIHYTLEESIRGAASLPSAEFGPVYDDPIPAKFGAHGQRIYPFHHSLGFAKVNERYEVAPFTHYIPKPIQPIYEMRMTCSARVMFDEEQNPVAWIARAVFVRGEARP